MMFRITAVAVAALLSACATVPEVEMAYAPSGHMTVPVFVGDRGPYQFVLDTGADTTVVYQRLAGRLGLPPAATQTLQGQTGQASLPGVRVPGIRLDGLSVGAFDTVILPDRSDGKPLDGIVGANVFGSRVLELDYPGGVVRAHRAGTRPKRLLPAGATPVTAVATEGKHLLLPVTVNGVRGTAVLDSGAKKSLMNSRFARAAGVDVSGAAFKDDGTIIGATNQPMVARRGPIGRIGYGGISREGVSMRVVDLPAFDAFGVGDRPAMLLGHDLLQDLHVVVDYPRLQIWFARP